MRWMDMLPTDDRRVDELLKFVPNRRDLAVRLLKAEDEIRRLREQLARANQLTELVP